MARTLAELQDVPAKKRRKAWPEKTCRFCGVNFTPQSGMGAKSRERCYSTLCEARNDTERRRQAKEGRRTA